VVRVERLYDKLIASNILRPVHNLSLKQ